MKIKNEFILHSVVSRYFNEIQIGIKKKQFEKSI